MKKTVLNLAVASCFAFGVSLAQASAHADDGHGHGDAHASSGPYQGHTDITGQTQNIKVGADGVRLPYNMAQDRPSVDASEHGVRVAKGVAQPYFVGANTPKPTIESNEHWNNYGTNRPSGSNHNVYPTSSGRNYYNAR